MRNLAALSVSANDDAINLSIALLNQLMVKKELYKFSNHNFLIFRVLMSHTGPVWALQRKGDILVSGSGDKTVSIALPVEHVEIIFRRYKQLLLRREKS